MSAAYGKFQKWEIVAGELAVEAVSLGFPGWFEPPEKPRQGWYLCRIKPFRSPGFSAARDHQLRCL